MKSKTRKFDCETTILLSLHIDQDTSSPARETGSTGTLQHEPPSPVGPIWWSAAQLQSDKPFHPSQNLSLGKTQPLVTAEQHLSRRSGKFLFMELLTYFLGIVLRPPTDTGDCHSCSNTTVSEGHRCGNQEKNSRICLLMLCRMESLVLVLRFASHTYCEKLSKDFGYTSLPPSHKKMTPLEKGLYLGYSSSIKTQHKKAPVNPVDRIPSQKSEVRSSITQ